MNGNTNSTYRSRKTTLRPVCGLLHLMGAILAIPATILLVVKGQDSIWKVVSFSVYGTTLFLMYLFSVLYHWIPKSAGGEAQVFRKLDHLAIYGLIAGSYTPFCLIALRGPWGWSILGIEWGLAITFIVLQSIYINLPRRLTTAVYGIMGWVIIVAVGKLLENLPLNAFVLLFTGGIIYTLGAVIYATRKPNFFPHFGYHELWHALVLLASLAHYLVIYLYLA